MTDKSNEQGFTQEMPRVWSVSDPTHIFIDQSTTKLDEEQLVAIVAAIVLPHCSGNGMAVITAREILAHAKEAK